MHKYICIYIYMYICIYIYVCVYVYKHVQIKITHKTPFFSEVPSQRHCCARVPKPWGGWWVYCGWTPWHCTPRWKSKCGNVVETMGNDQVKIGQNEEVHGIWERYWDIGFRSSFSCCCFLFHGISPAIVFLLMSVFCLGCALDGDGAHHEAWVILCGNNGTSFANGGIFMLSFLL
jgi:hypothetical protein